MIPFVVPSPLLQGTILGLGGPLPPILFNLSSVSIVATGMEHLHLRRALNSQAVVISESANAETPYLSLLFCPPILSAASASPVPWDSLYLYFVVCRLYLPASFNENEFVDF